MMPVEGDIISEPKTRLTVLVTATAFPSGKFVFSEMKFWFETHFTFIKNREVSRPAVRLVVELRPVVGRVRLGVGVIDPGELVPGPVLADHLLHGPAHLLRVLRVGGVAQPGAGSVGPLVALHQAVVEQGVRLIQLVVLHSKRQEIS